MIEKFKKIAAFISTAVMMTATFLYFPSGTFKGMSLGILANALDEGELPFIPTEHTHKYENGFCTYGGCKEYETVTDTDNDGYYEISNAGKLYSFAAKVNAGEITLNAVLTADIVVNEDDLSGYDGSSENSWREWTPIGNEEKRVYYNGTFDGRNHTISGLYFNDDTESNIGLIGSADGANIKRVGVVNSYFKGRENIGGICGDFVFGTISECYNTATVIGKEAGGICGLNNSSSIENCFSIGKIIGDNMVGGITGSFEGFGIISNCYYDKTVFTGDAVGADYTGNYTEVDLGKTTEQFASGEVAMLLGDTFGQTIGTDEIPVLGGPKVYKVEKTGCGVTDTEEAYSNTNENIVVEHSFENGICTKCEAKEEAKQNSNGYYEISNAGQLYSFAAKVNAGEITLNAVLTADIVVNEGDLSGYDGSSENSWRDWTPIGSVSNIYSGTFDGQNHTVSGLYFNDNWANYVGLFGWSNGTIQNIGIICSYFYGYECVGSVCGITESTIRNCYNTGTVFGSSKTGGMCGYNNYGTIENCYNIGTVFGTGSKVGGVCGYNNNDTVTNCYYRDTCAAEGTTFDNTDGTSKTAEQFASGEVAILLGDAFGQTIGTDEIPVLGGPKVYYVKEYSDCGKTTEVGSVYSNSEEDIAPAHDYSKGGICNACNALENGKDGFKSASVSLTDGVIVNYNVILSKEAFEDEKAYINFKSESGINKNIKFSEAVLTGETYKFSLELRPDQMSETITAQVIYGDETEGNSVDFSIKEYSEKLTDETDKALADSMKLYGAFAQVYTGRKTDNLVSGIKDYETNATIGEEYNYSLTENISGIKTKSATLQIGSQITIAIKYQLEEGKNISDYTFMCGDKSLEPVKNGDYYCVYLRNILPQDLDKMYEIVVKDKGNAENETTLKYSAFSYMKNAFEKSDSEKKLTNLLNAMYYYNKAAEDHMKG